MSLMTLGHASASTQICMSVVLPVIPLPWSLGFRQDQEGQDALERVGDVLPRRSGDVFRIVS
jgi:hypothetical protein